jgi:hypothetical protein
MSERKTLGLTPLIIVEPNPTLVEYYQIAREFEVREMLVSKVGDGEWLYIQSNMDQNIFLLKRMEDLGLIPETGKVCDCGIGLGTAIFDIYLQSKELVDYLVENLLDFWNEDLEIIQGDLMDQRYDEFDIVYCYTPFRDVEKLRDFYLKVISEMSEGSILIENKNWGLGEGEILSSISEDIVPIDLDGITIFQKKSASK